MKCCSGRWWRGSIKGNFEFEILNFGLKFLKAATADGRRVPPSNNFRTAHTFCEFVIDYIGVHPLLSAVNCVFKSYGLQRSTPAEKVTDDYEDVFRERVSE